MWLYAVEKLFDIPVPSREMSLTKLSLGGNNLYSIWRHHSRPGRVWSVTSRLRTEISKSFFHGVARRRTRTFGGRHPEGRRWGTLVETASAAPPQWWPCTWRWRTTGTTGQGSNRRRPGGTWGWADGPWPLAAVVAPAAAVAAAAAVGGQTRVWWGREGRGWGRWWWLLCCRRCSPRSARKKVFESWTK